MIQARHPVLVVAGTGMAGAKVVEEVLAREPDRFSIRMFGAEPCGTYNRILLSPVLAGEQTIDEIMLNGVDWYARNGIALHLGKQVTKIDRTRRIVDGAASTAGYTLHHVATVTQFATMMSFVRAGVGIAIVPSGAIAGLLGKDLAILTLSKPRLSRDVGLIWLRDRELTPAARGFAIIVDEMWRGGAA